ncbi:zinc c6 transcription factor [Ophiostoma piceae UAMH 11346]|uniref:Zinc c6 transcription factor n=1 Tax=Ophiostoma piceae (strain UAMH 11346) TaxID=1262450 RepID=S3CPI2_OPHP1|nr:zinc c6 transcription factor [Ophiostoma piceae UAMH 11346]
MHQVQEGSLQEPVLWAIMAMAARLTEKPSLRSRATEIADWAKTLLKQTIDCVALWNIQACMLVGNLCVAVGDYQTESLWYGVAIHMAKILHLPRPDPEDDAITIEVKLRVWWSLYMMDRWSSAGNGLQRQLSDETDHPLPMEELQFQSLARNDDPSKAVRPGIWGQMVRLASIFARIQDSHRQHAGRTHTEEAALSSASEMEATAHRLAGELDRFSDQLPSTMMLSDSNMRFHAGKGLGSAYVALHLGFHHYATLLYFPFLDHQLERSDTQLLFASRCKHHAAAFSDLLKASHSTPSCEAVHTIVGHMTVVSSAALLHTLLFGEDFELPLTRQRLETNFETLVRLQKYWPAVGHLMDRLFAFQRACMWSADPNTHKIDRWMMRFLLNHALPVSDRESLAEDLEAAVSGHLQQRGQFAGEALSILRPA